MPQFPANRKEKRSIITSQISGFIGLAYEGISSFLHNRIHKSLHKAVKVITTKVSIQHNKFTHLEDSMVMYGIYNTKTLEKLIHMVQHMHNITTQNERLFAGQFNRVYMWYINTHGTQGIHHYAINSLLYLRTIK